MGTDSPVSVAAAYFDAWRSNDIERLRPLFHPGVEFDGALGSTRGLDDTLAGLKGMFAMTKQVEVIKRWVDGPDVLTWFELHTATAGPLAIVNWTHVEAGLITRIRVTFDPRPLLASGLRSQLHVGDPRHRELEGQLHDPLGRRDQ